MSITDVDTGSRWKPIGLWAVKILLAAVFIAAGGAKLYGVPMMIDVFEIIGLGQWFRYITGALEVIGAILILIPALSAFGALLLCCIMIGATLAHLLVVPGSPMPALILFALSGTVVFAERRQLSAAFDALNG
jgi:putative oxidoreductase